MPAEIELQQFTFIYPVLNALLLQHYLREKLKIKLSSPSSSIASNAIAQLNSFVNIVLVLSIVFFNRKLFLIYEEIALWPATKAGCCKRFCSK